MAPPVCPSFSVPVGFPVFGLGFTAEGQLVVAGGGGAGRTGVQNKLVSFKVEPRRKDLEEQAVYDLPPDQDAPMCLDAHPTKPVVVSGINDSEKSIKDGRNESCRLFDVLEDRFDALQTAQTVKSTNPEEYQKVARFSYDGTLIAAGTTEGKVHLLKYPDLAPSFDPVDVGDEVMDVDIALEKDKLVCVLRDSIKMINLRGRNAGKIIQSLSPATVDKKNKVSFRAFRYGRGYCKESAFAVVNQVNGYGFICQMDPYTLEIKSKKRVSKKPITAACVSRDGGILAVTSSDLSIIILDAISLRVLTRISNAHGFSITSIAISHDRRLLATGSADNSCRIAILPEQFPPTTINPLYTLLLAIIVAFIALGLSIVFSSGRTSHSVLYNAIRPPKPPAAEPVIQTAPGTDYD